MQPTDPDAAGPSQAAPMPLNAASASGEGPRPAHLSTLLRHNRNRIILGVAVSGGLLWLALRSIGWEALRASIASASMSSVAVALACYWVELALRASRWRAILRSVKALSFPQVAKALLVGYAANNVLPARLGELFRADFIARRYRVSRLSALATIFVERLLDMLVVLLCAAVGIGSQLADEAGHAASPLAKNVIAGVLLVAMVVCGALLFVYLLPRQSSGRLRVRFPWIGAAVEAVRTGIVSLKQPRTLARVGALSALVWLVNGLEMWIILQSVGITPSAQLVMLVIGIAGIAAAIPSAPASIGTLQFAFITVGAVAGYSKSSGFAAASLIQFFFLGSVTAVGALLYAIWSWRGRPAARVGAA